MFLHILLSAKPPSRNTKIWQADLCLHYFWPSLNQEALEISQNQLCLTGYPVPRFCHPTEYNVTHVHTNLLLIFHPDNCDKQIPQTIRHMKALFLLYRGSILYSYFKVLCAHSYCHWHSHIKTKMCLVIHGNKPQCIITKITKQADAIFCFIFV